MGNDRPTCRGCGTPLTRKTGRGTRWPVWCSVQCRSKFHAPKGRVCRHCEAPLSKRPGVRGRWPVWCSKACERAFLRSSPRETRRCRQCGQSFHKRPGRGHWPNCCSKACRNALYRPYERARRSAQRAGRRLGSPVSDALLVQKFAYWGNRCWMCGSVDGKEIDHVKPKTHGGAHLLVNIRPACRSCNASKSDRWPYPVRGGPNWQSLPATRPSKLSQY